MSNHVKNYALSAITIALVSLAGCFPESSIEWSADGSVGLFSVGGKLALIDGDSGELTMLETGEVMPLPCMSDDGQTLVYCEAEKLDDLDIGLKALPPGQVAMIKKDAEDLKRRIGDPQSFDGQFGAFAGDNLEEPYRYWVIRYLCQKDIEFAAKLKKEHVEKALESDLTYFSLKRVLRKEMHNIRPIAISAMPIWRPRLSPDGRNVAYLMAKSVEDPVLDLMVGEGDIRAMHVATNVSLGYDWRRDSRALLYCKAEDDNEIVGTIQERVVVGSDGKLAAGQPDEFKGDMAGDSTCDNEEKFLVGVLFNKLMKAEYGIEGRVFFSSAALSIPTTELQDAGFTLFCFDPLTRTVARTLSSDLSFSVGESLNLFSLSPDGTKVLLPMEKNRFAIYTFGSIVATVPISEEDKWGDDMPMIPPSWKGNDQVTALISNESSLLTKGEAEKAEGDDGQLALFNSDGEFVRVLIRDWPQDDEQ